MLKKMLLIEMQFSELKNKKHIRYFENEVKTGYDDLLSKQKFMRYFENEVKTGYDDLLSKQKFMRYFENVIRG